MRFREFVAFASIVLLGCCVLATGARACFFTYTPTANGFCDGCKYEAFIAVGRNEACERNSIPPGNGQRALVVEYLDARIVERAKHGVGGASGTTIGYKPDKDYVGSDEFVKVVVYRQNGKLGRYTVRYLVTVK